MKRTHDFFRPGQRAELGMKLGGGSNAEEFLAEMAKEIQIGREGFKSGNRITPGKTKELLIEAEKRFHSLELFIKGLPLPVKRKIEWAADRNEPFELTYDDHYLEPLLERLHNFSNASRRAADGIRPVRGRKWDYSRSIFLWQMLQTYVELFGEPPAHYRTSNFHNVAKQLTALAKFPTTGLEDELASLKQNFKS